MDSTTPIITRMRAQYPAPISERDSAEADDEYCVGTALCRFYGYDVDSFVGEHELAGILAEINPALDGPPEEDNEEGAPEAAWELAIAMTDANDERDFEAAWRVAAEALGFAGQAPVGEAEAAGEKRKEE